jgi:hypothetical protein
MFNDTNEYLRIINANSMKIALEGAVINTTDRQRAFTAFKLRNPTSQIRDSEVEQMLIIMKHLIPEDVEKKVKMLIMKRNRAMLFRALQDHDAKFLFEEQKTIDIVKIRWHDQDSKKAFYYKHNVDLPNKKRKSDMYEEEEKIEPILPMSFATRICVICHLNEALSQSHPFDDRVSCSMCREKTRSMWELEVLYPLR